MCFSFLKQKYRYENISRVFVTTNRAAVSDASYWTRLHSKRIFLRLPAFGCVYVFVIFQLARTQARERATTLFYNRVETRTRVTRERGTRWKSFQMEVFNPNFRRETRSFVVMPRCFLSHRRRIPFPKASLALPKSGTLPTPLITLHNGKCRIARADCGNAHSRISLVLHITNAAYATLLVFN